MPDQYDTTAERQAAANAEEIGEDEYRNTLQAAWLACHLIEPMPIGAMIRAAEHSEAFAPYLDPTAWMNGIGRLKQDMRMLRALRAVQLELTKIREDRP